MAKNIYGVVNHVHDFSDYIRCEVSALPLHSSRDPHEELDAILRQVGRGDRQAFEWLYHRLAPRLYRYLADGGLVREAVEEALQETFLAVWRDARGFVEGSAEAWVFGVARHKRADVWRQQARGGHAVEADGRRESSDPKSESAYLAVQARAMLAALSRDDRELAHLVWVQELSYREVAAVLGIPVGTVKSRMARIRRHWQEEALKDV